MVMRRDSPMRNSAGHTKVSDIFDEYDVQVIQRKLRQDMLNAHCLDVARTVGVELDGGDPQICNALRVYLSRNITFNDADAPVFLNLSIREVIRLVFPAPGLPITLIMQM